MMDYNTISKALSTQGFAVINGVYSKDEIGEIAKLIDDADQSNDTFRKTSDLFAIRKCLAELPQLMPVIFNQKIKEIITELFGDSYFISKSIYFDNHNNQTGL